MSRVSAAASPVSSTAETSWPVISRPQVAALTNGDGDWPTWARHSPPPILSAISASRVAASGMRSSASARHISATPSWLDSVVFAHQSLHQAGRRPFAQGRHQPSRHRLRLLDDRRRQFGGGDERRHDFGLGGAIERVDYGAPAVVADELGGEGGKRLRRRRRYRHWGGQRTSAHLRQDGKNSDFLHAINAPLKGRSARRRTLGRSGESATSRRYCAGCPAFALLHCSISASSVALVFCG